jgi:hypothetical protein
MYSMCAALRWSSFQVGIVGNDVGGKDNELLSFINIKKEMRVAT